MSSTAALLRSRRMVPLLVTQTLGALNDNLFKNALTIFVLFQSATAGPVLAAATAGIFILPYALVSAQAGQLADRFSKPRLIRLTKFLELAIMAVAVIGFLIPSIPVLLVALFGLGVQAALFSPLKYGILPEHLGEDELVAGNGLIEAGTFLGILAGTIIGGLLIATPDGPMLTAVAGLVVAVAGIASAFAVLPSPPADPSLKVDWHILRESVALIRQARQNRPVWLSILGLSWFWTIGAILLSEFPVIADRILGGSAHAATLLLTVFAVGIGIGSVVCANLLHGEVSARHVPFAAVGISLLSWDFATVCAGTAGLNGVEAILTSFDGWRMIFDLFLLAVCGGVYSVPLYAILQHDSAPAWRSRMIGCNNIVNAIFMVIGSGAAAGMAWAGLSAPEIILVAAAANAVVAVRIIAILPQTVFKSLSAWVMRQLFKVETRGLEKLRTVSGPMVIVSNHVTWIDGMLMNAFIPGDTLFAINTHVFKTWWGGLTALFADMLPVDPTSPMATRVMIKAVESGRRLVIFPEGRLTRTGGLMKVYSGPAVIADKAGATVVPVRLDGVQFSNLSRLRGKMPLRSFPKVTIEVMDPVRLDLPADLKGPARRRAARNRLYDIMSGMMYGARRTDVTLLKALADARAVYGSRRGVLEDPSTIMHALTYDRILAGAATLGRKLSALAAADERLLGIMLPNSAAVVVTFFGVQAAGRVPAMLNFSAGAEPMLSACSTAVIRTVITSRAFITAARLGEAAARLGEAVRLVYLEDLQPQGFARTLLRLPLAGKRVTRFVAGRLAGRLDRLSRRMAKHGPSPEFDPDAPAVVLFTSGSEGTPKGVVLSHRNLLSNMAQLGARVDFNASDVVLNALPVFHSFGITGGMLLPLLSGIHTFMYVSPLHYKIVPEMSYDINATILFGTDTFLTGYARHADGYDFYSVRYVFAGAERVRDETRRVWMEKFGIRILEGYGTTETSPVLAVNTPMHFRAGTVGRLLPDIASRLEPVEGIDTGGRLWVHGPNVMLGYLRAERPGVIEPPPEGWYDTGDIVTIDEDGFVKIAGRAKRFVKIGGEMISLTAVEADAGAVWPGARVAAVGIPDPRKGERIVLLTEQPGASREALMAHARAKGLSELRVPRVVLQTPVPLLGTGKADYTAAKRIALAAAEGDGASEDAAAE